LPAAQLLRGHRLFALVFACWVMASFGPFLTEGLLAWSAGVLYVAYDTWLLAFVGWKTRRLHPRTDVAAAEALPIAVIIPARNEATVLSRCLDAVLPACSDGDEIWLADDGSTDGTAELLRTRYGLPSVPVQGYVASGSFPMLRVLRKAHSGKADSLNQVWPATRSPLIVTLDADTVLKPGALCALRRAFAREPNLAAACGTLIPRCAAAPLAPWFEAFQRFEYLRAFLARAAWERMDALLLVSGAFAAYRREVLADVGGFDPQSLVEDYELMHRIQRVKHERHMDWRVRVLGEAQAETDAPARAHPFLRQRERWFAGFLETQFANRDMVGNRRYGELGRLMLPIKAVDTLQPVFGLTAFLLLLWFLANWSGTTQAVLWLIALKLTIDLAYHIWAIDRYHRWIGEPVPLRLWPMAMLASLLEPFSFQLLRHLGALRGWIKFLTGRVEWAPQRRIRPSS
jgi:cellulose synthase/poly-beta-1,6-N-acetylglucosamine synthase-like glycosyltransferase